MLHFPDKHHLATWGAETSRPLLDPGKSEHVAELQQPHVNVKRAIRAVVCLHETCRCKKNVCAHWTTEVMRASAAAGWKQVLCQCSATDLKKGWSTGYHIGCNAKLKHLSSNLSLAFIDLSISAVMLNIATCELEYASFLFRMIKSH